MKLNIKVNEDFFDEMVFLPIQGEIEEVVIKSNLGTLNYEEAGFEIIALIRKYLENENS